MDFLLQPGLPAETRVAWIERFLSDAEKNHCGYEPYPIALRGINWVKFLIAHGDEIDENLFSRMHASLYAQYHLLKETVEYHLLGNHLLEDGFSLLIGGIYFSDPRLFEKGRRIVVRELNEQVLKDGGHFELSPMYHRILLGRLLDCIHIVRIYSDVLPGVDALLALLQEKAANMRGWMDCMRFADGSFPLLNDSAEGIAYADEALDDYADRLGIPSAVCHLGDSGYRKIIAPRYECFVDIGPVGPAYIPGHAHADTFNFILRVDGRDMIYDTGTSTYEKNQQRQYERSTSAHNTVVVDGKNSSDVWGGFRVGRKARVSIRKDTPGIIMAEHDGYGTMGIGHRREWLFTDDGIEITDWVSDRHGKEHVAILNLSPDFEVNGNLLCNGKIRIEIQNAEKIELVTACVSKRYNDFIEIKKARILFPDTLKTHIDIL